MRPKTFSVTIQISRTYTTEVVAHDEEEARDRANQEVRDLIHDGEMDFQYETEDVSVVEESYVPPEFEHG